MYHVDKATGDLVIDSFQNGIAPSPHLGIANLQCININTEPGEASVTYARVAQDQQTISGGTLNYNSSNSVSYIGAVPLLVGSWIDVTATTGGLSGLAGNVFVGNLESGTTTDGIYQIYSNYSVLNIITGLSAGTATFTTDHFSQLIASTFDIQTSTPAINYFMMDNAARVMWYNSTIGYWIFLQPHGPSNATASGLQAFNGYLFRFYNVSGGSGEVDYASITSIVAGDFVSFAPLPLPTGQTGNLLSNTTTHQTLSGHDNTMYYTDGQYVGSIGPAYTQATGTFTVGSGPSAVFTAQFISGINLVNGMNITMFATVEMPSGLNPGQTYYVVDAGQSPTTVNGTQTFSVASTFEGSAITPSNTGSGTLTFTAGAFQLYDTVASTPVNYSYNWAQYALKLPAYETAQCLAELGTNLMVGGATSNIYPWDRSSTTATTPTTSSFFYPLILPEVNTTSMVTVNNMMFIFAGYKGNIYLTNGSSVSLAFTIPDYVSGEIEPYFQWGAMDSTMYLRGRIWFSVIAPNCGGIWSFVPTLNQLALGSDVGVQLRLENQNSNGTYNGYASVLLPEWTQLANGPQYWSGTTNGATVYNLDFSSTGPANSPGVVESDAIPTGTLLTKKTFKQVEYKLSTALVAGESVQLYYRNDLGFNSNGDWVSCGSVVKETSNPLSGYFVANFQNTQWLQIRAVLTSTNSSPSFCRLKEIRVR